MNARRYRSYRRALSDVSALDESADALREVAEGLLLSRDPSLEIDDLLETAALTLTRLTMSGALSRGSADGVWRALCECGPGTEWAAQPTVALAENPR